MGNLSGIQKTRQPRRGRKCAGARGGSILLRQHDRGAGLALVAGMNLKLERVQAFPTSAGNDNFEQATTRKRFHRGNAGHPQHIKPYAFTVVAVVRVVKGPLDECRMPLLLLMTPLIFHATGLARLRQSTLAMRFQPEPVGLWSGRHNIFHWKNGRVGRRIIRNGSEVVPLNSLMKFNVHKRTCFGNETTAFLAQEYRPSAFLFPHD